MKKTIFVFYCFLALSSSIATANGPMGYNCNTMMGQYSPEMEIAAQRSRAEALAREQQAFQAIISPFIRQGISLSGINRYDASGVVLDIGQGRMSYALDSSYGKTVYPVIVKFGNNASHTYWMTMEDLEARTGKRRSI